MNLPVYKLEISDSEQEGTEVNFVSLVDKPAIQRDFLAFSARQWFAIQDDERRIVSGPAMIPDMPIYRRDDKGEYYVVFEVGTIEKIAQRFFLKGYQGNINMMHEAEAVAADSVFFESWLVDRTKGKQPLTGFDDLPDGTWFLTAKINDEGAWQKIKAGEYRGFSVEGVFDYRRAADVDPDEAILQEITRILQDHQ